MMGAEDVVEIITALEDAGIEAWLDGGWGIDALVGFESRSHDDLDLVVSLADVQRIERALASAGWVISEDARPTRVVLGDAGGRRIDLHTVTFDQEGGGVQELPGGRSYRYPSRGFAGKGLVARVPLSCLTAEVQIECHLGYEPDDTDRRDMRLLEEHLGVELPDPYRGGATQGPA